MGVQIQGVPLNRILTFPFQDAQSFQRFLVAGGLSLTGLVIPVIPGLFVAGYSIRILRQAIRQGEVSMPEWKAWDQLLRDGLSSAAIGSVYLLPGLLAFLVGLTAYFFSFLAIIPSLEKSEATVGFLVMVPMAILLMSMTIGIVLLLAGAIPLPVALARFADKGDLGAAFQLKEVGRILRGNPVGYIGAWVVLFGLMSVTYFLYMAAYMTVVLCCLGFALSILSAFAGGIIWTAMIGLAYRQCVPEAGGD
jgi:hypothetical protein